MQEDGFTPEALARRPSLLKAWGASYEVYHELKYSKRTVGMTGKGFIPFSEVASYAAVYGYSRLEAQELWRRVHLVDKAFYQAYANIEKANAESKKTVHP